MDGSGDYYVIIKDHKVVAVEPRRYKKALLGEDYYEERYEITPYEREWWTETEWLKTELKAREYDLKEASEAVAFLKSCVGKTDDEIKQMRHNRWVYDMGAALREVMNYESLARQIFKVTPVENK